MKATEALWWAFIHFYHTDMANAAIHTSPVRFSPITFRLAEQLRSADMVSEEVLEVESHAGKYEEDKGR